MKYVRFGSLRLREDIDRNLRTEAAKVRGKSVNKLINEELEARFGDKQEEQVPDLPVRRRFIPRGNLSRDKLMSNITRPRGAETKMLANLTFCKKHGVYKASCGCS